MRSSNEIAGLILKAGRGAGLPLGVAEDLAASSIHMDHETLEDLAVVLETPAKHTILSQLCSALDARACGSDETLPECGGVGAAMQATSEAKVGTIGAREVADDLWRRFEVFAHATFVASSEASREAGAGAGLDDND